jgi:uncharacterized sulfatase
MNTSLQCRLLRGLRTAFLVAGATAATLLVASGFDYQLQPQKIAADTWVFLGKNEDFSLGNGGNIVNTGFIVTSAGVVVIDSGPSRRYGEQMRQAIAKISNKSIIRVFITHQHPDHFLGNQAYPAAALRALPATIAAIAKDGNVLAENMYRLNGDWMAGTEAQAPTMRTEGGKERIGNHQLRLIALSGHTDGDLALYDEGTGVLFTGDLTFNGRAPTTPNAHIAPWLASLDQLATLQAKVVVPGHGPLTHDLSPIHATRDYLHWLTKRMDEAAAAGLDMTEVLARPLPPEIARLAVSANEYRRSVGHLYPAAEQAALKTAPSGDANP